MSELYAATVFAGPLLLLTSGLIPVTWANQNAVIMRMMATCILAIGLLLSLVAAAILISNGHLDYPILLLTSNLNIGIYYDSIAAILLPLISYIGLIIAMFTSRYLEGEENQGRFVKWMSLTIGSVMLMIVSRNLVMFTAAWMLTSYSLHHLLLHYPERPWAVWAARKKFSYQPTGRLFSPGCVGFDLF